MPSNRQLLLAMKHQLGLATADERAELENTPNIVGTAGLLVTPRPSPNADAWVKRFGGSRVELLCGDDAPPTPAAGQPPVADALAAAGPVPSPAAAAVLGMLATAANAARPRSLSRR